MSATSTEGAGPAEVSDEDFAIALEQALGTDTVEDLPPAPRPRSGVRPIEDLSHTHEAIMNWLIANPEKNLGECAIAFGYTRTWISIIVNSDCFKVRLKEKQDIIFGHLTQGLGEKLHALADVGIEKIAAQMEKSEDPRFLMDATKLALQSMGFGAKPAPGAVPGQVNTQNVQNNFYVASPEDLSAARMMMQARAVSPAGAEPVPPAEATPLIGQSPGSAGSILAHNPGE